MTNKEASYNQEHMVAKFLGWKVVTGSGARPFRPGDVQNDNYLVECKTHTKEQKNIVFYKKHWDKIVIEARSVNKYPALIVDDGTQRAENTWVMIPERVITFESVCKFMGLENTSTSGNTITFSKVATEEFYKQWYRDNVSVNYIVTDFDGNRLAVLKLSEFKKFYQEQFES